MPKKKRKPTRTQQKVALAKRTIKAHPEWSRDTVNDKLKKRFGNGLRKQAVDDLKAIVLRRDPRTESAVKRVEVKRRTPPYRRPKLKVPKSVTKSGRVSPDFEHHRKYSSGPRRMPRPDLPHEWFVDVEFSKKIETKKGKRTTRFTSVYLGTYTRDQFTRAYDRGTIMRHIKASVAEVAELDEEEWAVVGFWTTKKYQIP